MPYELLEKYVLKAKEDLSVPPTQIKSSIPKQFVYGDLHANALKLVRVFMQTGLLVLSDQDYGELYSIYSKLNKFQTLKSEEEAKLFIEYRNLFITILQRAQPQKAAVYTHVILLGDVIYDRGPSNQAIIAMLDFIEKLYGFSPFTIIYSNHDHTLTEHTLKLSKTTLSSKHFSSLARSAYLDELAEKILAPNNSAVPIVSLHHYAKWLKIIDYQVGLDKNNRKKIIISTHAPSSLKCIYKLAHHLQVDIPEFQKINQDLFLEVLTTTIDKINAKFKTYLERPEEIPIEARHAITRFIWRRMKDVPLDENIEKLPVEVLFFHGHDGGSPLSNKQKRAVGFDNQLGKCDIQLAENLIALTRAPRADQYFLEPERYENMKKLQERSPLKPSPNSLLPDIKPRAVKFSASSSQVFFMNEKNSVKKRLVRERCFENPLPKSISASP